MLFVLLSTLKNYSFCSWIMYRLYATNHTQMFLETSKHMRVFFSGFFYSIRISPHVKGIESCICKQVFLQSSSKNYKLVNIFFKEKSKSPLLLGSSIAGKIICNSEFHSEKNSSRISIWSTRTAIITVVSFQNVIFFIIFLGGSITDSQSNLGWKGPGEVVFSNLLLKIGITSQLDHVAQGSIHPSFEYLQRWRSNSLSGETVWPPSRWRLCSLHLMKIFLTSKCLPCYFFPVHVWEESDSIFSTTAL